MVFISRQGKDAVWPWRGGNKRSTLAVYFSYRINKRTQHFTVVASFYLLICATLIWSMFFISLDAPLRRPRHSFNLLWSCNLMNSMTLVCTFWSMSTIEIVPPMKYSFAASRSLRRIQNMRSNISSFGNIEQPIILTPSNCGFVRSAALAPVPLSAAPRLCVFCWQSGCGKAIRRNRVNGHDKKIIGLGHIKRKITPWMCLHKKRNECKIK